MRKLSVFLLFCFLIMPFCLYAADEDENEEEETSEEVVRYEDPFKDAPKKPEIIQSRAFEIGFNINPFFSNNFISIPDVFRETIKINMEDLANNGFILDFGAGIRPFYFMVDSHKGWGFGLSTDIEVFGIVDLNKVMLSLDEADGEDSVVGGSVFISAGIDTFFHIKKFKVKLRPALFYSAAFLKTDVTYTFLNTDEGTELYIDYEGRLYTAFPMNDIQPNALTGTPGLDFSIGFEYPLSKEVGISSSVFDFDVGVDFINIPIFSSTLNNFRSYKGRIGGEKPINILDDNGMGDLFSSFTDFEPEEKDEEGTYKVERPFKMLMHANWRPGGKQSFTVIPVFGFAYNKIFLDPFGVEAGINLRLSAANMIIILLGTNYSDRAWNNSLDFALNFKAFEINIGAKMRSRDLIKSWTGHGVGVNLGLKLGL